MTFFQTAGALPFREKSKLQKEVSSGLFVSRSAITNGVAFFTAQANGVLT